MEEIEDLAIVLRAIPYEDRHRIVTAITPHHGKISAMAKNAVHSRRFGATLEPFAAALWKLQSKKDSDFYFLRETETRHDYSGLRANLEKLALASAFNEILIRVAPSGEACPDLFKLHSNALKAVEEWSSSNLLALLNAYLVKILQWCGNQPQPLACLHCQKPLKEFSADLLLRVHVENAGWICPECHPEKDVRFGISAASSYCSEVSVSALWDFVLFLGLPIRKALSEMHASEKDHERLFLFLEALLIYHIPGFDQAPLKSLKWIKLPEHARSIASQSSVREKTEYRKTL